MTAARRSEVLGISGNLKNPGATWAEINTDAALWIVPGNRMKADAQHVVPLSEPVLLQRLGRRDDRPPREVIEESLAHSLSAVEAAYKRRPILMRRRSLMADWATFLVRPCAEALAEWEKTLNAVPKREVLIRLSRVAMANPEPFIFPGDQTRDE